MKGQILVLGAAGRLGFAASEAFRDAGWSVKGLVRPDAGWRAPKGIDVIETNDRAVAVKEARGTDIVLHALNAPYPGWAQHALPLTYSAIEAAEQSGATLMFPGNVYNYGAGMPAVLDEATEMQPTSNKGKIRSEIELRLREASDRGVRTIVLRAGDFFGRGRGSWFDLVLIKELAKNKVTYPGPLDVVHEWTYLPDYIDALIRLATIRDTLGQYESLRLSRARRHRPGIRLRHRQGLGPQAQGRPHQLVDDAHGRQHLEDGPRADRDRLSLAGAAPDRRREAQGRHRRGAAHAARLGGDPFAARARRDCLSAHFVTIPRSQVPL